MKMKLTCVILLIILILSCFASCGNNEIQSNKIPTITNNENDAKSELNVLNESFKEIGYWTYEEDMYIFYDTGESVTPFIDYYVNYGLTDEFNTQLDLFIKSFMSLANDISNNTNRDAVIAIANPENMDNVILVLNKNEVLYNAFYEE